MRMIDACPTKEVLECTVMDDFAELVKKEGGENG